MPSDQTGHPTEPSTNVHPSQKAASIPKSLKKKGGGLAQFAGGDVSPESLSVLSQYGRPVGVLLGASLLVLIAVSLISSRKEAKSHAAREAFYAAQVAYNAEIKALTPAPPAPKPAEKGEKEAAPDASEPKGESILYKKMDVERSFPATLAALEKVTSEHSGTLAAFEARMLLGNLYLDHGSPEKAVSHYAEAAKDAPSPLERMSAEYSLAQAQESSGNCKDAVVSAENAINTGVPALKGDILVTEARCYETLKDPAKARSVYDRIATELAGTPFAKIAEIERAKLK